jgi:hypothetical protein
VNLKFLAVFVLDLLAMVVLIALVGIRDFGLFTLFFIIGTIFGGVVSRIIGMTPDRWLADYLKAGRRVKWLPVVFAPFIVISGLILTLWVRASVTGSLAGAVMAFWLLYMCGGLMYLIDMYRRLLEDHIARRLLSSLKV